MFELFNPAGVTTLIIKTKSKTYNKSNNFKFCKIIKTKKSAKSFDLTLF